MQPNTINLNYFKSDHKGHCGYCDSNNSVSLGFDTKQITYNIYQQLMDRGWRRCGTYFYKPNIEESCCMSYSIRLNANLFQQERRSHRKALKKFLALLQNIPENVDLKQYVQSFKDQKNEQKKLDDIMQSKELNEQIEQKESQKQIVQKIDQQAPKQNKIQQEIDPLVQNSLNEIFSKLINYLEQHRQQYRQCFNENILFGQTDIIIDPQVLTLSKLFKSEVFTFINILKKIKAKGDYYSNLLMLIYGRNKKSIFKNLSLQQFINDSWPFTNDFFKEQKDFIFGINEKGYITIFSPDRPQQAQKQIHKSQIQLERKKMVAEVIKKKQPIPIISYDPTNWQANKFKIGELTCQLKKAAFDSEAHRIYQDYCIKIHGKAEPSKQSYVGFLCEESLKASIAKSPVDNKTIMFMGCYHMCYYIQNKLIAVGVVDITETALSSVYFFYDPIFEDQFQFGIFAALVEIEYIQLMSNYFPQFKYYYMGFYLQSTSKMVYKGEFQPSELLCPYSYTWVPLDDRIRSDIDTKIKQRIRERKLRLSPDQVKVIDDMNLEGLDRTKFYNENVKVNLKQGIHFFGELNKQGQIQLKPYLDEAIKRIGKQLILDLIFDI